MMVVFKMRESVPTARYSPVCNVLRQWKTSLILTYRVYRLYDKTPEIPICKERGNGYELFLGTKIVFIKISLQHVCTGKTSILAGSSN